MGKIKYIILLILSATAFFGQAQTTKEKIEAYKVAFITKQVGFTPQEAQVFWPLYNAYLQKKENLRQEQLIQNKKTSSDFSNLSENEVEKLIDNQILYEQKEVDLKKEFHKQIKTILPPHKIAKLYKAEEDFKRELIKLLKEKS